MATAPRTKAEKLLDAFSKSTLFHGVDMTGTDAFLGAFRRGEPIHAVQNGVSCVGVLQSGTADVYTRGTAAHQNVSTLSPGSAFGICNVFLPREMPTVLHPKVHCTVAFLPKAAFSALLERDSVLLRRYLTLCNEKILYLADKVELMGIPTAKARFAAYLLRIADSGGLAATGVSKEQLAKYLSVSRASLFRAVNELTVDGVLRSTPDGFQILDLTAFSDILQTKG